MCIYKNSGTRVSEPAILLLETALSRYDQGGFSGKMSHRFFK
jgi:hypothetical protein